MTDIATLMRIMTGARSLLWNMEGGAKVVHEGGAFGDEYADTELKADEKLGEYFYRQLIHELPEVGLVSVEGQEPKDGHVGGRLWATVDPLDGSLNYREAGLTNGLPFVGCVTLLKKGEKAEVKFDDVVTACVIDLRRDIRDAWISAYVDGNRLTHVVRVDMSGNHVYRQTYAHSSKVFDLGKMVVIGEMYYPDNRERIARAFTGRKGWLRNPGAAAYEMALVASGQVGAFICDRQKQDVLGAGYALVKGAGGVALDWDGQDLGPRIYDFKTQTPVILACNRQIADQILELLRN